MSSQILVTGGAGYIGSHACKALARAGYEPIVLDNLSRGHEWAVRWGPLEKADIAHSERMDEVFARYSISAVMHFAAFAYVGESVTEPATYYRNNVGGTLGLLEAMRRAGVDRIVFSSTCATYGEPMEIPITEQHPQRPINPYGRSKLMIENVLEDYSRAYGLKYVALRYFNAAGADPDGDLGEHHDPETHLLPLTLQVAAGRLEQLTVLGDDYPTPDGTCIRDYIHVSDLADAHVLALEALGQGDSRTAYNLGNGAGYSVAEVIETCSSVTGRKIACVTKGRREGDPPVLVGDASAITSDLGWKPRFGELRDIVATAWEWEQRHF